MRSALVVPLAVLCLVASAEAAIVPGRSVGKVRLGMLAATVEARLGAPSDRVGDRLSFDDRGLEIDLVEGRVARIVTTARTQRLPGGLGVGSQLGAARAQLSGCALNGRRGLCSSSSEGTGAHRTATRAVVRGGRVIAVLVERLTTQLAPVLPRGRRVVIGRSVRGRKIVATRFGDPDSARKALVVAAIHGDEPLSPVVARGLAEYRVRGVDLWVIDAANPDGLAARRRQNAQGVDLNRNFAAGWRRTGPPGSRYYAGSGPFSAPESVALRELIDLLRPAVSIWFHQPYGYVIVPIGGDPRIARAYGRLARYPVRTPGPPRSPGQAPTWQNAVYPGTTAFIVELPAGPLPPAATRRQVRATVRVAQGI